MRRYSIIRLLILASAVALFALSAVAQENRVDEPQDGDHPVAERPPDPRFNLLRQLGLSREQIQRIRRMNAARRPLIRAAQIQFREANRLLDAAIYADEINEEDVRARLKDVQLAQAELISIRSLDELAVRRVLTVEQLIRFRELRSRFQRERIDIVERQQPAGKGGLRRSNGDRGINGIPVVQSYKP